MLVKYSHAFVVMPGGFGTLDELFEIATLVQTRKVVDFPIVLMGTDFWKPMLDFLRERMIPEGTISPEDPDRLILTDDPEEATKIVADIAGSRFGITRRPRSKPSRMLFEKNLSPR